MSQIMYNGLCSVNGNKQNIDILLISETEIIQTFPKG